MASEPVPRSRNIRSSLAAVRSALCRARKPRMVRREQSNPRPLKPPSRPLPTYKAAYDADIRAMFDGFERGKGDASVQKGAIPAIIAATTDTILGELRNFRTRSQYLARLSNRHRACPTPFRFPKHHLRDKTSPHPPVQSTPCPLSPTTSWGDDFIEDPACRIDAINDALCIIGTSGIGKSHTVRAYVTRNRDAYTNCWYCNAVNRVSVEDALPAIGERIGAV